ncbi:hypothetical protein ACSDBR_02735 [Acidithiobacillus ferriphilus]|uniref:hypothetical protein n=1 Tax=Acidithiobacillus ferriphilus TaxID=1689834 RepID=UPI003F512702
MATTMSNTALQDSGNRSWRLAAIALLAIRFVQGWIYWGGGTRRFIYGPQKLDVHDHWMAYKFQASMPGDEALPADHYSAPQAYLEPSAVPDRGHSFSLPASQKTAPGFSADPAYLGAAPNGTTEDFDVRA